MLDLGYAVTATPDTLRQALAAVGRGSRMYQLVPLSEAEVARLLVAMGNTMNVHGVAPPPGTADPAMTMASLFDSFANAVSKPGVFGRVTSSPAGVGESWRAETVVMVLKEDHGQLDWTRVIASLDFPGCHFSSPHAFQFVVAITRACSGAPFPTAELVKKPWNNARAHIEALRYAVVAPPEMISFATGADPTRLLAPVPGSAAGIGAPNQAWCCVDLYNALVRLAQAGGPDVESVAAKLLDTAQSVVPELVLLGMARSKVDDNLDGDPSASHDPNSLRSRTYNLLLSSAFGTLLAASSVVPLSQLQSAVLARLWDMSRPLAASSLLALVRGIAARATNEHDMLRASMEGVARVVQYTLQLPDFATVLLSATAPQLALEVAVYFSMVGGDVEARLNAETLPAAWTGQVAVGAGGSKEGGKGFKLAAWLHACLSNATPGAADRFAAVCVAFLKRVVSSQSQVLQASRARLGAPLDGSGGAVGGDLGLASGDARASAASVAEAAAQDHALKESIVRVDVLITIFRVLKAHLARLQPQTAAGIQAMHEAACKVFPNLVIINNQEVEELVVSLIQKIMMGQQPVAEVIEMLKRLKASSDQRDHETFQCFIHHLFDEYRFFSKYEEKDLKIAGTLFGSLIQQQIVTASTLATALRYVLEALKMSPTTVATSKMFRFGIYAIEQFKTRLPKWPQYCIHLVDIPHLRATYPEFVAEIEAAIAPHAAAGGGGAAGAPGSGTLLAGDAASAAAAASGFRPSSMPAGDSTTQAAPGGEGSATDGGAAGAGNGVGGAGASAPGADAKAGAATGPATVPPRVLVQNELRSKLGALGADLTVALAAAAAGQPVPAILPSAAAAAAAQKEAEEKAAAASGNSGGSGGGSGADTPSALDAAGASRAAVEAPPTAIADRYNFIINQVTESTVDAKVDEMLALVKPDHRPWLANFLVKRVATQANFQLLYRTFLEKMGSKEMEAEVLAATLDNIRRLLASDKIRTEARERSTLKNLGSWLGKITLGRSKPLLHRDMNLKELLFEAYESGRLIACVPFVAKVLEAGAESRIFRPPNPWTSSLLSTLRELYEVPDLKLNLKFEVEVLCKVLQVEVKDIRPSSMLHRRRRPNLAGSPDFNPKAAANPDAIPGVSPPSGAGGRDGAGAAAGAAGAATAPGGTPAIPGLLSLVTLRSFAPMFHPLAIAAAAANQPLPPLDSLVTGAAADDAGYERDEAGSPKANLRNVVAVSLDRALRELLMPLVERSVTISRITATELVTKDFAREGNADAMSSAARTLASEMAGALAMVTSQEPLRAAIGNHLRQLLSTHPTVITSLPVPFGALGDAAVNAMLQGIVAENLEVACLLVEKAAIDRACKAIDEALANAYALRRKAAEANTPFVDASVLTSGSRWPAALPEVLQTARPGGGLTPQQLRVYEAFSRIPTGTASAGPAVAAAAGGAAGGSTSLPAPNTAAVAAFNAAQVPGGAAAAAGAGGLPTGAGGVGGTAAGGITAPSVVDPSMGSACNAPVLQPQLSPGQALNEYNLLLERMTNVIRGTAVAILQATPGAPPSPAAITQATLASLPPDHELLVTLRELRTVGLRIPPGQSREEVCIMQAQKLFRGLFELQQPGTAVLDSLALQVYVAGLSVLKDVCRHLKKDVVSYLAYIPEERRFGSVDFVIMGLLRAGLVWLPDFDVFLFKSTDGGRKLSGLRFVMQVVQRAVVAERILAPGDLPLTTEILMGLATRVQQSQGQPGAAAAAAAVPPGLAQLIEGIRAVAAEKARAAAAAAVAAAGGAPGYVGGAAPAPGAAAPAPAAAATPAAGAGSAPAPGAVALAESGPPAVDETYRRSILVLLEQWVRIVSESPSPAALEASFRHFVGGLVSQGLLASDLSTETFLRTTMELCVQSSVHAMSKLHPSPVAATPWSDPRADTASLPTPTPRTRLSYTGVDALSKLVGLLIKAVDGSGPKISLVGKLLAIFARTLLRDADLNGAGCTPEAVALASHTGGVPPEGSHRFDQRPYLRLFTNLLRDICAMPPPLQANAEEAAVAQHAVAVAEAAAINAQLLACFANNYHAIRPERVPGFAFAWLELISSRYFAAPLLDLPANRGWALYHRLVLDLLRFMYPALRRAEMNEGVKLLYRGALRFSLVLHHDYPDFLADYAPTLLEVIPAPCIQLRNLVLAAAPKAFRVPDPFTLPTTSPMQSLPECAVLPRLMVNPIDALPAVLQSELDTYTKSRFPPMRGGAQTPLAGALRAVMAATPEEQVFYLSRYTPVPVQAIVLGAAHATLTRLSEEAAAGPNPPPKGTVPVQTIVAAASNSAAADILRYLLSEGTLDAEGRFLVLTTMANQLRYPNAHTLFFSEALLSLFLEPPAAAAGASQDALREQIVRVLLERLFVHRPHPWGLLLTFLELIRNSKYSFWSYGFTRLTPEIEKVLESVARTCTTAASSASATASSGVTTA